MPVLSVLQTLFYSISFTQLSQWHHTEREKRYQDEAAMCNACPQVALYHQ